MNWFSLKKDITDDAPTPLDWDETTLGEPAIPQRDPTLRKLINGTTILVVVVLIGVSSHWWLGSVPGLWATVFPPPPYTGTLVYGINNNSLVAMRLTDGHEQWHVNNIGNDSSTILYDANTIYVVNKSNERVMALHAQTGKQIWQLQTNPSLILNGGWLDNNHLYIAFNGEAAQATSSLLEAIDIHAGKILWQSLIPGTDAFPVVFHADRLLFCAAEHDANTASTMIIMAGIASQTGKIAWSQSGEIAADGGYDCGEAGNFGFIQSFGNTMENTLALVNEQTGMIQGRIQLLGQIIGADQDTVYTSTDGPQSTLQEMQAVSLDDGTVRWQLVGNYSPFYIFNGQEIAPTSSLLITLATNGLAGISTKTGDVAWKWVNDAVNGANEVRIIAVHGAGTIIYFANQTNAIALDSATGKPLWQTPFALSASPDSQLLYGDGTVFFAAQGQFQALQARDGKTLWQQAITLQNIFCLKCSS